MEYWADCIVSMLIFIQIVGAPPTSRFAANRDVGASHNLIWPSPFGGCLPLLDPDREI